MTEQPIDLGTHRGNDAIDVPNPPAVVGAPMPHRPQKTQAKHGPIPKRQGNGYYAHHTSGKRLRSVTTVLEGGVPKPALIFWAAGLCVDAAIEALPQLVAASRFPDRLQELSRWLKRAHTQAKEERGDVGSVVHTIIESHILGTPLPEQINVADPGKPERWIRLDDEEIAPIAEHFLAFVAEWEVTFTASEMVVANPDDGYAGTLDFLARSAKLAAALRSYGFEVADDADIMGDTKTGGTLDRLTSSKHFHGVYPEAGLQMSAYKAARFAWLKSGEEIPMPPTADVGIVLHLRPEGYRVFPARCDAQLYDYFRHAQMVDEFTSKIGSPVAERPVICKPLNGPHAPTTNQEK